MQPLFSKLQAFGFDTDYVRTLLPDWWSDSLGSSPAGLQQATLHLARLLAVRPDSLWANDKRVVLALPSARRFKHRANLDRDELDIACALAFSAARIAFTGMADLDGKPKIPSVTELRSMLLRDANAKWIGLPELVNFCFSIGIPVIYMRRFPAGAKKMEGLAFDCSGRPAIVLTRKNKYGYLLFDLAHELGHIALGHVKPGEIIVDEKIGHDVDDEDMDERDANRFALELLTGSPNRQIKSNRRLTGSKLASAAHTYGLENSVDPTHVALNYGYTNECYAVAVKAVNELCRDKPSDQDLLRKALFDHLDVDEMKEDDLVALESMVEISE
jgi:hypothetical protein